MKNKAGISLLIIIVYTAIAFMVIGSLLVLLQDRIILGKIEGRTVQARYISEAGLAEALAAYPEIQEATAVEYGTGYYWYNVKPLAGNEIEITSRACRFNIRSRLPVVQITTRWKVIPHGGQYSFEPLLRKEELLAARFPRG